MIPNTISVESRRRKLANIEQENPGAQIIDVTSKAEEPWIRFSPFYPHGNIPVPNSTNLTAQSVEGVWQALKVFDSEGIDTTKLQITNMKGIKRSVRKRGQVLGHQFGIDSSKLLDYLTARIQIYLPTYRYVLDNCLSSEISKIHNILEERPVILLDYETNSDIKDLSRPLSHASLVAAYVSDQWPAEGVE